MYRVPAKYLSSVAVCIAASLVALAWTLAPTSARAAEWRLRTYSLGRATQTATSFGHIADERSFTQGLTISAYDLLEDQSGSLNAYADAYYTTDFGIGAARRNRAQFQDNWNAATLRVGYLSWQPIRAVQLRAGRQTSLGPLAATDFDGFRLRLSPALDDDTRAIVGGYAGRDVEWTSTTYDSDTDDVQGIPASARLDGPFSKASGWVAGGKLGLRWDAPRRSGNVTFSYRRRWRASSAALAPEAGELATRNDRWIGSERFGVAADATPHRRFNLSAQATYHTLLGAIDRAGVDLAWEVPKLDSTAALGVEHRRPWFHASSIFNLFGAQPHQGVWGQWELEAEQLNTEFEARGWGRVYYGQAAGSRPLLPGKALDLQERRWGGALGHTTELFGPGRLWRWHTEVSLETAATEPGGEHLLVDTELRMPVFPEKLALTARALGLWASPEDATDQRGWAATWVVSADIPVSDFGTARVIAETTHGTLRQATTSLFGTLDLEFWP